METYVNPTRETWKDLPLPNGATLLPEVQTIQTGTWVPLRVDATVEVCGVTWMRVYGGFGDRFDREDWAAVLPGVSVSVCDYNWNGSDFGPSYNSFEDACRGQLEQGLRHAKLKQAEMESKLEDVRESVALLEKVLA